jgi:hypothetical protein
MANLDRSMLLTDVQTMDSIVDRAQTGTRFSLLLIAAFGASARRKLACASRWAQRPEGSSD